ncbi:MAG: zinc-binding dehydrogenase [Thermodesulfobacteriota bacterium]
MLALRYHYSIPRYALAKVLGYLWPRRFFPGLAPVKLEQVSFSSPNPDWIVLRSRLCGICGSDLNLIKGAESYLLEPYASFPAVLGHEVVAEVMEAPVDTEWRPGDRVVVDPLLSCQARGLPPCSFCSQGRYNLCENFTRGGLAPGVNIGFHRQVGGGMAEYLAAPPFNLIRVPESLADEAAVLTDSLASALYPLLENFPPDRATVVIYGAGIIGQHLIRLVRTLGSGARLVAVARYPFQKELARAGGADLVLIKPSRRELGEAVGATFLPTTLGGGNLEGGADFYFDCVGSRESLQEGLLALRGQGTYVLVGTAGRVRGVDLSSLWFRELRLTGSLMYAYNHFQGQRGRTYQLAVDLLARGDYPLQGLLTHILPLKDYGQAFKVAFNKSPYRCVKVALDLREVGRERESRGDRP